MSLEGKLVPKCVVVRPCVDSNTPFEDWFPEQLIRTSDWGEKTWNLSIRIFLYRDIRNPLLQSFLSRLTSVKVFKMYLYIFIRFCVGFI